MNPSDDIHDLADSFEELELQELFVAHLEAPSAGFARRTLGIWAERQAVARRAAAERLARVADMRAWAGRAAALWLLLASGAVLWLAALVASGTVSVPGGSGGASGLGLLTALTTATWEWIVAGLSFWEELAEMADYLVRWLSVPEVAAGFLAASLAAVGAFQLLRHLISDVSDVEDSRHVETT